MSLWCGGLVWFVEGSPRCFGVACAVPLCGPSMKGGVSRPLLSLCVACCVSGRVLPSCWVCVCARVLLLSLLLFPFRAVGGTLFFFLASFSVCVCVCVCASVAPSHNHTHNTVAHRMSNSSSLVRPRRGSLRCVLDCCPWLVLCCWLHPSTATATTRHHHRIKCGVQSRETNTLTLTHTLSLSLSFCACRSTRE